MLDKEEMRKLGYSEEAIKDIEDYREYLSSPVAKLINFICENRNKDYNPKEDPDNNKSGLGHWNQD